MSQLINKPNEITYYIVSNKYKADIRYGVCGVNQVLSSGVEFELIETFTDIESWKLHLSSIGITVNVEDDEIL